MPVLRPVTLNLPPESVLPLRVMRRPSRVYACTRVLGSGLPALSFSRPVIVPPATRVALMFGHCLARPDGHRLRHADAGGFGLVVVELSLRERVSRWPG